MKKVQLEMTEAQARKTLVALDLFYRIHMGQLGEILYNLNQSPAYDDVKIDREHCERIMWELRAHLFPDLGGAHGAFLGIRSEKVPEHAKTVCDVYQAIRHAMAWDRSPEGGITVDFDKPTKFGSEPMPTCSVISPNVLWVAIKWGDDRTSDEVIAEVERCTIGSFDMVDGEKGEICGNLSAQNIEYPYEALFDGIKVEAEAP